MPLSVDRNRLGIGTSVSPFLFAVAVLSGGVLAAEAASSGPSPVSEASRSHESGAPSWSDSPDATVTSVKTRDGVRVRITLPDSPLVAGRPAWIRTAVKNVGTDDLVWYPECGVTVWAHGELRDATWHTIESEDAGLSPSPGLSEGAADFFQYVLDSWVGNQPTIYLRFVPESMLGPGGSDCGGDVAVPSTLRPGEVVVQSARWDGGTAGELGPPPSGPVRIVGRFAGVDVALETIIVGGRDASMLDPADAVREALADPSLQHLLEPYDFGTDATAVIRYVPEMAVWAIGACSYLDGSDVTLDLALVDPDSAEVVDTVRGSAPDCDGFPSLDG